MDRMRIAALLLLAACFGVALAAGPYGADIRSLAADDGSTANDYATGFVNETVIDTPDTARLDQFQANGTTQYRLLVPAATVNIANVSGRPGLTYKLQIDGLGHTRGTTHVLSTAQEGRFRAALNPSELATDRVQNDSYTGDLTIIVRSDRGTRFVHESTVTVRVTD
jgi:hypothetical protein